MCLILWFLLAPRLLSLCRVFSMVFSTYFRFPNAIIFKPTLVDVVQSIIDTLTYTCIYSKHEIIPASTDFEKRNICMKFIYLFIFRENSNTKPWDQGKKGIQHNQSKHVIFTL